MRIIVLFVVLVWGTFGHFSLGYAQENRIKTIDIQRGQLFKKASRYLHVSQHYFDKARYDSSISYINKASAIFSKLKDIQYLTMCNAILACHYCVIGKFKLAKHYLNRARTDLESRTPTNPSVYLIIDHNIARVYQYESIYDTAMVYYNNAIRIYKNNHLKIGIDIVKVYNNIGSIYEDKAENKKALLYYHKALNLGLSSWGSDNIMICHIYNNIGLTESELGNFHEALQYYHKDLTISKNILGKNHPDIGKSYVNIGDIFYRLGDYDNAEEYYKEALRIFVRFFGINNQVVAQTYNNIGAVFYTESQYRKAIDYFKKSMVIKRHILGTYNTDVAIACLNIGDTYYKLKKQKESIYYLKKALSINLKLFGPNNPNIAPVYDSISQSYSDTKKYKEAIRYLLKELRIYKKSLGFNHPNTASTLINIGQVYKDERNYPKALQYFQESLNSLCPDFHNTSLRANPHLSNIRSDKYLLQALRYKAETLLDYRHSNTDLMIGLLTYDLAIRLINTIRKNYKAEGSKLLLGEQTHSIFEGGIKTCLALYNRTKNEYFREKAFSISDESKSNVLLESILDSRAKKYIGIPDGLLLKEESLRDSLTFYETQLHNELAKGKFTDSLKVVFWQNKLFSGNRNYDSFVSNLEKRYPRYYNLKFRTPRVSIRQIQNTMLHNNTALISYFKGDSTLYIFSLTKHNYQIKTEKIDSNFVHNVKVFRKAIIKSDYNTYTQKAFLLYKLLLAPARDALKKTNLLIIPDGILGYLPFGSLISKPAPKVKNAYYRNYSTLHYVVLEHNITYNYSAMLLNELQSRPENKDPKEYLGVAPVFDNTNFRGKDTVRYGFSKPLSPLPASEKEVKDIYNLFERQRGFWSLISDDNSKILLRNQATESYMKSNKISQYKYIHLATHAFVNENDPELSGVVLARKANSKEDGILYSGEIYNLKLNARLVVLSACETALGKLVKGEGIMSLTRSFLYAGASNVIVSLWDVTDKSTSKLMIDLYKRMLQKHSISSSLADAKRKLILKTAYSEPVYWASFILTGQ